jgi:hypothetical protein
MQRIHQKTCLRSYHKKLLGPNCHDKNPLRNSDLKHIDLRVLKITWNYGWRTSNLEPIGNPELFCVGIFCPVVQEYGDHNGNGYAKITQRSPNLTKIFLHYEVKLYRTHTVLYIVLKFS